MTKEEKSNNPELVEQAKRYKISQWWFRDMEDVVKAVEIAKETAIIVPTEAMEETPSQPAETTILESEVPEPVPEIIEAKKVVDPTPRKVAPKMPIVQMTGDPRSDILRRRDAENPGIKHLFQKSGMSDEELAEKGLERTGEMFKNDIIVRTDSERYAQNEENVSEYQRRQMDAIDMEGEKILSLTESPQEGKP